MLAQALLEVFVTRSQSELQDGKKKWEGRTDKSLVDYLNSELGSSYRHLNALLQKLYMGDRAEVSSPMRAQCMAWRETRGLPL